jgi:hypothetical protein
LESSTYVVPPLPCLVDGFRVEVGHPKKTRYIAEARIKSDRVDSKAIAELVRLEALPQSYKPPPTLRLYKKKSGAELSCEAESQAYGKDTHCFGL